MRYAAIVVTLSLFAASAGCASARRFERAPCVRGEHIVATVVGFSNDDTLLLRERGSTAEVARWCPHLTMHAVTMGRMYNFYEVNDAYVVVESETE